MAELPKSLKIGLVLDTSLDPTDGVQQYVVSVGEWLRSQGHDVHYLVGQTQRNDLKNIKSLSRNIGVWFNGNRTTIPLPASRRRLRTLIKTENFDVLHVQTPHHPLMAQHLVLAAGPETAVIGTFHILPYGQIPRLGNKALGLWLKPSLKRFDKLVAVSPAAADYAISSFKLPADVLPNVFNYHLFNIAKPLSKYDDDKLTVLFLGRLVARKGCLKLLEAIVKLRHDHPDLPTFRVVICGKGHQEAGLRKYVNQHNLGEIVEFVGFVSEADKPSYYASADISVFPSSGGESFGIVLLEAMASGRAAVLAGNNPGYASVMEPQPDLLFNPQSSHDLADKLFEYLTNAPLRQSKATWGAQYTQAFDVDVVGGKLVDIYLSALRKRRGL